MLSHALARAARVLLYLSVLGLVLVPSPVLRAQNGAANGTTNGATATVPPLVPNYEAASNWTSQKVSKLVFDTTVSPRRSPAVE